MQAPANTGGVHLLFFPHIHWVPLETESADAIQIYQTVWLTWLNANGPHMIALFGCYVIV